MTMQIETHNLSFISVLGAAAVELSREVPADDGFLCDKAGVLDAAIKKIRCSSGRIQDTRYK